MENKFGSQPRRPGEHRNSAAVRERILATAIDVISRHGYSGMTMARVASTSGLPVGSVYWHFESKDLLLAALIDASFERWHREMSERNKPLPGEAFEAHVRRVFGGSPNTPKFFAADFWRLGVILSVEKSVPEQTARAQFLKIREMQRDELTSWWKSTLPRATIEHRPDLPERLSAFALALQDGNAIAGTSGESLDDFQRMLATCLIHLVQQADQEIAESARVKRGRSRAPSRAS